MSANPGRRVIFNAALSASTWFLPLALSFLVTPILLSSLGRELYGVYALVMGFIGYSFAFGIGKVAAKYVAEQRAAGSNSLAGEYLSATFWFSSALGLFGASLVIALSGPLVRDILSIDTALADEAERGLFVAAGIILITTVSQVWSFTLQGLQRYDRFAVITAAGSILLNAGTVFLAWRGVDLAAILMWNLAATLLTGITFFLATKVSGQNIRLTLRIRPSIRSSVLRYGSAIILSQLFGNLLLLIERGWIARYLGVEALTFYVVPMTLALFLHAFVGSLVIVLFPVVNERLASPERIIGMYRFATKCAFALVGLSIPVSVIFGERILGAWVGSIIAERSAALLTLHLATFGLLASATVAWHVAESFGHARLNVMFSFVWLVVGAILMFVLGGSLGLEGVAFARLIGCLGVIPLAIVIEARVLGSFSLKYWLNAFVRLGIAAGISLAIYKLLGSLAEGPLGVVLIVPVGAAVFAAFLAVSRYFTQVELDWFLGSIRKSANAAR